MRPGDINPHPIGHHAPHPLARPPVSLAISLDPPLTAHPDHERPRHEHPGHEHRDLEPIGHGRPGALAAERKNINQSLLTLGRVITALKTPAERQRIPCELYPSPISTALKTLPAHPLCHMPFSAATRSCVKKPLIRRLVALSCWRIFIVHC